LLAALDNSQKVGKLFGVYHLNSCPAMLPIIYSWNSANTSGYTKRVMRNALTLIAFCVGNLIGPQMFVSSDAPNYNPAKITLIVTMAGVVVLAVFLRQLIASENQKRDKEQTQFPAQEGPGPDLAFSDLTDIQNRQFRYLY